MTAPTWPEEFNQLVAPVIDLCDELGNWQFNGERRAVPGSQAAADRADESQWADDAYPDPVVAAQSAASLYTFSAIDYLRGAADVFHSPSLYSRHTLARASIEAAAYGAWLLDPDVALKDRLQRALIDQVWTINEAIKFLQSIDGGNDGPQQTLDEQLRRQERFVDWGIAHDLLKPPKDGKSRYIANLRPAATTVVDEYASAHWTDHGETMWRFLSGTAHTSAIYMASFEAPYEVPIEDGSSWVMASVSIRQAVYPIAAAVHCLQEVVRRRAQVNGWEPIDEMFDAALRPLLAIAD